MKAVELIIFDLDGTLVDSRRDIVDAVNFTLREVALKEKSFEEVVSYVGTGVEELIKRSLGEEDKGLFKKALSIFEGHFQKHSADKSRLYPNVTETLGYFKDKRKAVVTNRRSNTAVITLKALNIYGYFDKVIGGDDAGCMKPSSCPLVNMMQHLKVTDKKKAIIVGDMNIDVLAGKNADILTCAVTYGIGKRQDIVKAHPDYIIDDIAQLKDIIY